MKRIFVGSVCFILSILCLAGCGQKAAPEPSSAAAQGQAKPVQKTLSEEEMTTLKPLLDAVAACAEKEFKQVPDPATAAMVVYALVNSDVYTEADGERTQTWVSDALLEKIYTDCFENTKTPLDFSSFSLMERKDNGYTFSPSDTGQGAKIETLSSEKTNNDTYQIKVNIKSYDDLELSGTGKFIVRKNKNSKFGFCIVSWEYVWNA